MRIHVRALFLRNVFRRLAARLQSRLRICCSTSVACAKMNTKIGETAALLVREKLGKL
jgi:hypothetical protein